MLQSVAGDGDLIDATGGLDSSLLVRAVTPGSATQRAGLQASVVIIACNGRALRLWSDLAAATAGRGSGPLQLEFRRNQSTHHLKLTPVPPP